VFTVLAIMVDLGWPWWVTTLIAAVVALLAAWAFVRTRRATIRAVAALVLLEAIAIGIIAPFVMKSNKSTSGTPAMSSGSSGGADFAQKADANCSALNAYIATLGKPKTPAEIERQMDQLLPAFWRKIVAQGELSVPRDKQTTARQWMHSMAAFGRDYESLRAAASHGDAKGMQRANASANADATRSGRLSKDLGLHVCFQ
jgi:uncharacterized membrane protein YraQ (UPF0718 family)